MDSLLRDFITLWVVIDPIGTLPVFLAVTFGVSAAARRRIAVHAVLVAFVVLTGFILAGQLVLEGLGIPLPSFQLAGGIVLFLFALSMIFGPGKPQSDLDDSASITQTAVFPVAIPSIASPGAMLAVVILTDNDRFSVTQQAMTAGLMAVVLAATLAIMLAVNPIHRLIGDAGASVISRVMGMILAAVAVDAVLNALQTIGALPAMQV
ncbi:MarC family protein [Albimonas sp. CAU 1670]|uniref:MarC family protein n=1 Tax=Albimonas sp. CAU 1670 TaxID=3032599 RepID=UPI0023DAE778|nr:MarC family protein [Albimonas sp. CAU 1670]MDF2234438.1 MarC family protein [Albimonas sp. CAU 1670]